MAAKPTFANDIAAATAAIVCKQSCSPRLDGSLDDTFNAKPFFALESAGYRLPTSRAGRGWG
ncbi:MAG: hypothetical protein K8L97_04905, partial [Anaerolineae bacterium]|nr:hypothetical protein [Anaerolineae bacterium]